MPWLKKDAPPELIEALDTIESRAEAGFQSLDLFDIPTNVALWSLLVGGVRMIENNHERLGSDNPRFGAVLANVGRFVPIALTWAKSHGRGAPTQETKRWTKELAQQVDTALSMAKHYGAFLASFPMWHKNRYEAGLVAPSVVRFTATRSDRERQVRAYQQGVRPTAGMHKEHRVERRPQSSRLQQLFESALQCSTPMGRLAFDYPVPWDLWRESMSEYRSVLQELSRRSGSLSLGDYNLAEFNGFYAALMSVCAVHEFMCFAWWKNYDVYPLESAVLVRDQREWSNIFAELSGVPATTCDAMINDLTFDFGHADLHVQPFIRLDSSSTTVAVAPQFPLHSRHDENVLRVCSVVRPKAFAITSLAKESEMRGLLDRRSSRPLCGPVSLPKPLPDIDLIVADAVSSTLVIVELKWVRKAMRPLELIQRDEEVLKGLKQIRQVREFLQANPEYLARRGVLPAMLDAYSHVHYLVVARDHFLWVEPSRDAALVAFDPFADALARNVSLHTAMDELLKYEWLPIEGRDFTAGFERATVNGVSAEPETYYAAMPAALV